MPARARVVRSLLLASAIFAGGMITLQLSRDRSQPLPRLRVLPDFQLTERSGKAIGLSDLKGKVWLADFVYTTCPGPCPMLSSHFSALQKRALESGEVRLVSISTDPAKDTPEVLRQYAAHFQADERWLFLTGEKPRVYELIQKGFLLAVAEQDDAKDPVVHSTKIALVDKQGVVRRYYDGQDPAVPDDEILRDIRRLLRE